MSCLLGLGKRAVLFHRVVEEIEVFSYHTISPKENPSLDSKMLGGNSFCKSGGIYSQFFHTEAGKL